MNNGKTLDPSLTMMQRITRRLRFELWRWSNPYYGKIGVPIDRLRFLLFDSPKLRALKNIHAGKRCFIIGNGPSIKQQDLTLLRDEFTFAVNWFVLHPDFEEIDIKFYCMSDHNLLWAKGPISDKLAGPLSRSNSTIFVHRLARSNVEKYNPFRRQLHYIWLDWLPKVESGTFSTDIANRLYHGRTVIIDLCLPIAHYMGFSEVYLLGCDCDYSVEAPLEKRQDHFYDESVVRNHGDTQEYSHKELEEIWDYFSNYRVVSKYFQDTGRQIYNAGIGGKLEIFPRIALEEVLSRSL